MKDLTLIPFSEIKDRDGLISYVSSPFWNIKSNAIISAKYSDFLNIEIHFLERSDINIFISILQYIKQEEVKTFTLSNGVSISTNSFLNKVDELLSFVLAQHILFIRKKAGEYYFKHNDGSYVFDDLLLYGVEGFISSLYSFNKNKGYSLLTYSLAYLLKGFGLYSDSLRAVKLPRGKIEQSFHVSRILREFNKYNISNYTVRDFYLNFEEIFYYVLEENNKLLTSLYSLFTVTLNKKPINDFLYYKNKDTGKLELLKKVKIKKENSINKTLFLINYLNKKGEQVNNFDEKKYFLSLDSEDNHKKIGEYLFYLFKKFEKEDYKKLNIFITTLNQNNGMKSLDLMLEKGDKVLELSNVSQNIEKDLILKEKNNILISELNSLLSNKEIIIIGLRFGLFRYHELVSLLKDDDKLNTMSEMKNKRKVVLKNLRHLDNLNKVIIGSHLVDKDIDSIIKIKKHNPQVNSFTLEEIGMVFSCTRERIRQLESQILLKMKNGLNFSNKELFN